MLETIIIAIAIYLGGYFVALLALLWRDAQISRLYRTWPKRYERLDQKQILTLSLVSWGFVLVFLYALLAVPSHERWR